MFLCSKCGIASEGEKCKPCRAAYMREYYHRPGVHDAWLKRAGTRYRAKVEEPEWLEKERERGREKYHRLYKAAVRPRPRRSGADPRNRKARIALGNAVRDGRVQKPAACQGCGTGGRIQGHHPDYSKPLEVMWLCTRCHGLEHRKNAA